MKLDATPLEIAHALRLDGHRPEIPVEALIHNGRKGETARITLHPEDKSGKAYALVTRHEELGRFAVQFVDDPDSREIAGAYRIINDTPIGLTTDLSAGEVHLKLSRIGKRADVRAWPIRDTVISRWYHGRTVLRTLGVNSAPLTGEYKSDTAKGQQVYVHLDIDNPAGIPSDTWLLDAADFKWEVYCPVDVDELQQTAKALGAS